MWRIVRHFVLGLLGGLDMGRAEAWWCHIEEGQELSADRARE
jgi:hypothetical protein